MLLSLSPSHTHTHTNTQKKQLLNAILHSVPSFCEQGLQSGEEISLRETQQSEEQWKLLERETALVKNTVADVVLDTLVQECVEFLHSQAQEG